MPQADLPISRHPVRPVVLIIRDGWGEHPDRTSDRYNAVRLADTPVADAIAARYPRTLVATSGFDVGLPEGTMGNSEVGHQNLGAGRVVDQESVAITKQVRSGEFRDNPVLNAAVTHCLERGSTLHLLGIVSDAGVHGQLEHLYGCLDLAKHRGLDRVALHAFTDGRDTPPNSGLGYIRQIEETMAELGVGRIATVTGRYFAMDRDRRWDRVRQAYDALRHGIGTRYRSAIEAVEAYYAHPPSDNLAGDEFIPPSIVCDPPTMIDDGDAVLFYNYRGDRPRQITQAFVLHDFDGFDRGPKPDLHFVTMTAYEQGLPVYVAYPKPPKMSDILGEVVSRAGLKQFRCAETEKFPHVTFFFNDYREEPFEGEERHMAQSPRDVATYDQKPEMAAEGITTATVDAVRSGRFALLVVNYANGDMVGHTGSLDAATRACEIVDAGVGRVLQAIRKAGGAAIVTADHGNAEMMADPITGAPHTAHTTYPVELVIVDDRHVGRRLRENGRLADVAPTLLDLMSLQKPPAMTGTSLLTPPGLFHVEH